MQYNFFVVTEDDESGETAAKFDSLDAAEIAFCQSVKHHASVVFSMATDDGDLFELLAASLDGKVTFTSENYSRYKNPGKEN